MVAGGWWGWGCLRDSGTIRRTLTSLGKFYPTGVKLICCDGHLEGFRFFLNCILQPGQLAAEEDMIRHTQKRLGD